MLYSVSENMICSVNWNSIWLGLPGYFRCLSFARFLWLFESVFSGYCKLAVSFWKTTARFPKIDSGIWELLDIYSKKRWRLTTEAFP